MVDCVSVTVSRDCSTLSTFVESQGVLARHCSSLRSYAVLMKNEFSAPSTHWEIHPNVCGDARVAIVRTPFTFRRFVSKQIVWSALFQHFGGVDNARVWLLDDDILVNDDAVVRAHQSSRSWIWQSSIRTRTLAPRLEGTDQKRGQDFDLFNSGVFNGSCNVTMVEQQAVCIRGRALRLVLAHPHVRHVLDMHRAFPTDWGFDIAWCHIVRDMGEERVCSMVPSP